MNTELLTCRRLTVGIVFPAFPLEHAQVNRIYADVTERFPYQQMQHLPDGGRMSNATGDFFIQTTRMQVNENIDYFHATKDKTIDLFNIAQTRMNVPQFTNFGVKLTASLPAEGKDAAAAVERGIFKSVRSSLDKLSTDRKGIGMRVVIHKEGIHEIKIEPLFSDMTQIYIDLDVQYPQPFTEIKSIEPKLAAAYDFLFGEIRSFIEDI